MITRQVNRLLDRFPQLDSLGSTLSTAVHNAVLESGDGVRTAADFLHGTWLGHPLHSVLTDLVVGGWSLGFAFDLLSLVEPSRKTETIADALTNAGNVAAVPTVLSGIADFSTIPQGSADVGVLHAATNDIAFTLQILSSAARREGDRERAILLSGTALLVAGAGAWLGGHLVYDRQVGVNQADSDSGPDEWTTVMQQENLDEATPERVEVDGAPVVLYRQGGRIRAIGAVCPHAGAPLEEGKFADGCVTCPWHDSVFSLEDGAVVHGPSTYPVPAYEARIQGTEIQVRKAS